MGLGLSVTPLACRFALLRLISHSIVSFFNRAFEDGMAQGNQPLFLYIDT
jgi:hypothetical protein